MLPHADSVLQGALTDIDAEQFKAVNLYIESTDSYLAKLEWTNQEGKQGEELFLVRNRDGWQHYVFDFKEQPTWRGRIDQLGVRFLSFDDYAGTRAPLRLKLPQAARTANLLPAGLPPPAPGNETRRPAEQWKAAGSAWTLRLETLQPGATYRWSGASAPEIVVETMQKTRVRVAVERDQRGAFVFVLPLDAVYTDFYLRGIPGEPLLELLALNSPKLPATPTGNWKAAWIWYPEANSDGVFRYFRKVIRLVEKPDFARVYITVDDAFKLLVNGVEVGSGKNWGVPKEIDISEELRANADNVIAVEAFNALGGAGVRAEVVLGKKGAPDQVFASGTSWQCSASNPPGWDRDPKAQEGWKQAVAVSGPSAPYEYVGSRAAVTLDEIKTSPVAGGLSVEMKGSLTQAPAPDSVLLAKLTRDGKTYFFGRMSWRLLTGPVGNAPGRIQITGSVPTGRLDEGSYQLRLTMAGCVFRDAKNADLVVPVAVTNPAPKKTLPTTAVRWVGKRPEIVINGKGVLPYLFHLSGGFVNSARVELPMVMDAAKNGVHLFAISNEYFADRTWPEENTFDFSEYDDAVQALLAADPEAKVILLPSMNMPTWWQKAHPDDVITPWAQDGVQTTPPMQSPASELWRADGQRYLRELIKHVERSDYADALIGVFPAALQTIEWVYPPTLVRTDADMTDYCPASKEGLRKYVQAKYGTVEALRRAYGNDGLTFAEIGMPPPDALQGAEIGRFRDPKMSQAAVDYWEFRARATVDTLLAFCKTVKEASGGKALAGSYFGYLVEFWPQQNMARSGHAMLERALASQDVDVLCAPADYLFRLANSPAGTMSPADSLRINNKLWVQEDDIRGYLAQKSYAGADNAYYHGKTDTVADSLALLRKQYAINRAQGYGFWWFDLNGGYFANHKLNEALLGRWVKAEQAAKTNPPSFVPPTEVAFVLDGQSAFYDKMGGGVGQLELRAQNKTFNMLAAPRDVIQLRDFETAKFSPYKLYVFLNCFVVEPILREKIHRKLAENGALAVWVHSAGFFDGTPGATPTTENIRRLTGFQIGMDPGEGQVETEITEPGAPAIKWAFAGTTAPRFYVEDAGATAWSQTDGKTSAGFKNMEGWKSAYFSSPYLPPEALRFLCGKAGVTLYSQENDYYYLGEGFVAANMVKSGDKHFKFPMNVDLTDYESGRVLARGTKEFVYPAVAGETYLFGVSRSRESAAK